MCGRATPRWRRILGGLLCALLLHETRCSQAPSFFELTVPRRLGGRGLAYAVTVGDRTYTLKLGQNRALVAPGFSLFSHTRAGTLLAEQPHVPHDCYYQGWVEGLLGSIVALSACSGLRGILQTEDAIYGIQPAEFSFSFQHLLYRLEDVDREPRSCFTAQPNRSHLEEYHHKRHLVKSPQGVSHYLELYAVVDHDLYLHYQGNTTHLTETVFQIINMAGAMFTPLNLHLVLLGMEIWKITNAIPSSGNIQQFLQYLAVWKEENVTPRLKVDMTVLFTKNDIQSTVGATYTGEICWGPNAVMFVAFTTFPKRNLPAVATTLAHELGHALGMQHDPVDAKMCHCPLPSCIMFFGHVTTSSFSDCSVNSYGDFIASGSGFCLRTIPSVESLYTMPYCGNKVVEGDEQCDCGTITQCAFDPCCDVTCKLKGDAQCSYGGCCKGCQFIKQGTPCRKPVSECDLAEYCNGTSAFCPDDVYSQDGSPCNYNQSFCVSNKCYDYVKHCRRLFGKGATVASKECFSAINTNGDRFGNCGFDAEGVLLKKCENTDVMCGRLQCENASSIHIYNKHSATIQTPVGNNVCWGVDHHYSYIFPDLGAVEDGAKCDIGKVCLNRACVNISFLNYDCDMQKTCSGHGVCNNNKNCHCNKDWAPPDCKYRGHGGSIDSGPLIKGSFLSYVPKEKFEIINLRDRCASRLTTDIAIILCVSVFLFF